MGDETMDVVEADEVAAPSTALAVRESNLVPTMVGGIAEAKARLGALQEFVREAMIEGEDYGTFPGVAKKVLLQPGAEKLMEIYGFAGTPIVTTRVEDWSRQPVPFFHYEVRFEIADRRTGSVIGTGLGSCNSMEGRYRWRDAQRACPSCGAAAIIKGKAEYGGGWVCFARKGGCGAKFTDDDSAITSQSVGRAENDDVASLVNTILKMAVKRAKVAAVLAVTRSSAIFTQDLEDTIGESARTAEQPRQSAPQSSQSSQGSASSRAPRKNQYAGACLYCNDEVEKEAGYAVQDEQEKWRSIHKSCHVAREAEKAGRP